MEISTKMLKDIRAYYSTGKMKGQLKIWNECMMAAAKNLIPCTLELGGKCPVIIDKDANIPNSAIKAVNGKMANQGQIAAQRAGASIGMQESKINMLRAQEASRLQMAERGGAARAGSNA